MSTAKDTRIAELERKLAEQQAMMETLQNRSLESVFLLARLFNGLTLDIKEQIPDDIARRISASMFAHGYVMILQRWCNKHSTF